MYRIVCKKALNDTVTMMEIEAPLVAKHAEPGQFIILRVDSDGERIPLTVSGFDRKNGTVRIIFSAIGATTLALKNKNEGEYISDFAGPLGNPTELDSLDNVLVVGGGVGTAIALPIAEKLFKMGKRVRGVIGFRTKALVILEEEFRGVTEKLYTVTDDGSHGEKGNACMPIERLISEGDAPAHIIVIGSLVMMKFVSLLAKKNNIPCTVSMNPIMIDGTGMCGGCRVSIIKDGKRVYKFACVDGPDFNGWEIDFDEAQERLGAYVDFERHRYEEKCNLFKKESKNGE